jgi:CheY-like chemotaxis protein
MIADHRSIRIDATLDPVPGAVLGDGHRLQQVFVNLLSNAVKFTPEGGRVAVRLGRNGTAATIAVEDSGCGIEAGFLPFVFDRFRQAEEGATTRKRGGLGLGLSIVRHIVEAHGGSVTAESPGEGRGATFTVTLPLVSPGHRALTDERAEPIRTGSNGRSLDGVRALVVDDDPDACDVIEAALRDEGAEVRAVRSARAALDALLSFRADVLLSDIGMPEEDGYALIGELRRLERCGERAHVPALALTAFASLTDREQALSLGFEAHLAKPASPRDLAVTVARLVARTG